MTTAILLLSFSACFTLIPLAFIVWLFAKDGYFDTWAAFLVMISVLPTAGSLSGATAIGFFIGGVKGWFAGFVLCALVVVAIVFLTKDKDA